MTRRNKEELDKFTKYCKQNPRERFWQALRNFSGYPFILASKDLEGKDAEDTFYWEETN